ncbi:MAG: hypothetical protein AABZ92_05975, partial [Verrucomicrobiota bacterium]
MAKFFSFFLLTLYIFTSLPLQADEYAYFYPKLHQNLWPDFCLEHQDHFSYDDQKIDKENIAQLSLYANQIPTTTSRCDFRFCLQCQTSVAREVCLDDDGEDEEGDPDIIVCYKCRCLKNWYNENNLDADEEDEQDEEIASEYWENCGNKAVPHKYFTNPSNVSFLEQHVKYCQENPTCLCYWPHRSKRACEISDVIYTKMYPLVENSSLGKPNSPEFPCFTSLENTHDVLNTLFIHSFFYSQYRQVLLQLAQLEESHPIIKSLDEMQPNFLHLYSECLKKHPHPKIYYERGMV